MISLKQRTNMLNLILREGNKKEFTYKGYICLIARINESWHLCGYIKYIPETRAEWEIFDYKFHGGVTYNNCIDGWLGDKWIGFDCMHSCDIRPQELLFEGIEDNELLRGRNFYSYRDMEYVEECLKNTIDDLEDYKSSLQNNL